MSEGQQATPTTETDWQMRIERKPRNRKNVLDSKDFQIHEKHSYKCCRNICIINTITFDWILTSLVQQFTLRLTNKRSPVFFQKKQLQVTDGWKIEQANEWINSFANEKQILKKCNHTPDKVRTEQNQQRDLKMSNFSYKMKNGLQAVKREMAVMINSKN